MKSYEEIRDLYLKRYPHLRNLTDCKAFAKAALQLAAPKDVSVQEIWLISMIANGLYDEDTSTVRKFIM